MAHQGQWVRIAKESGVSPSWISKFVNDEIPNPGYYTLDRLNIFLKQYRPKKTKPPTKPALS